MLAAAIPVLSALAGAVMHYGFGEHDDVLEAWWWAISHLVDPGSLSDDDDWPNRIVGLALAVGGLVVLAGLVLTVFSDAVARALTRLNTGGVPPDLAGHVVFVGWSPRLPEVVAAYRRAAAQLDDDHGRLVVLLDADDLDEADAIRSRLAVPGGREALVVFAGADDTAFAAARCEAARAVVVVARTPGDAEDTTSRDLGAVQRALLLERYLVGIGVDEAAGPRVVVEATGTDVLAAARPLLPARVDAVVAERVATAILRDGIHHPAWARAMEEAIDPVGAAHVMVVPVPQGAGRRWIDVVGATRGVLPLGLARAGAAPVVVPPADTPVGEGDALVALAPVGATARSGPAASPATMTVAPTAPRRVLTLGWSSLAATFLAELAEQGAVRHEVTNLADVPAAERRSLVADGVAGALDLQLVEGRPSDATALAEVIAAARPHAVVVHGGPVPTGHPGRDAGSGDADAVLALLRLPALVPATTAVLADLVDSTRVDVFAPSGAVAFVDASRLFASAVGWLSADAEVGDVFATVFDDPGLCRTVVSFDPPDGRPTTVASVAAGLALVDACLFGVVDAEGRADLVPPADRPVEPGTVLLVVARLTPAGDTAAGAAAAADAAPVSTAAHGATPAGIRAEGAAGSAVPN